MFTACGERSRTVIAFCFDFVHGMRSTLLKYLRRHARRLVSLSLALALLAASIPLPYRGHRHPDKDRSVPFPCQDRPCGCRSAEQCWKHCCCFNLEQKLSWARHHGVRPPAFVLRAARTHGCAAATAPRRACCASTTAVQTGAHSLRPATYRTCCKNAVAGPRDKSCCAQPTCSAHAKLRPPGHNTVFVAALLTQKCQGAPWGWSVLTWSTIPEPLAVRDFWLEPALGRIAVTSDLVPIRAVNEPPVPPPRLGSVRLVKGCVKAACAA